MLNIALILTIKSVRIPGADRCSALRNVMISMMSSFKRLERNNPPLFAFCVASYSVLTRCHAPHISLKLKVAALIKYFRKGICRYSEGSGVGRGRVTQHSLSGEAPPPPPPPQDPTSYPFIYNFRQKRYPFCIPSIDKWYPFSHA